MHQSGYLVRLITESNTEHIVDKDKKCSCGDRHCRSVLAVTDYLRKGGQLAPGGMPPCPICGSKTFRDRAWDGKYTRELGWRCQKGGLGHFLQAKAERIQKNLAENPWLFPPASGYPGVRRDEILTWEECEAKMRKYCLETGYDPNA